MVWGWHGATGWLTVLDTEISAVFSISAFTGGLTGDGICARMLRLPQHLSPPSKKTVAASRAMQEGYWMLFPIPGGALL